MPNTLPQKQVNLQFNARIPDAAWKSTVPILINYGTNLQSWGTGTLLCIADQSFVVTAAHVVKTALKNSGSLCLAGQSGTIVQANGSWLCSEEGQYGTSRDPFDIAVLPLDSATIEKLSENLFLRLDEVDFNKDQAKGIFCLFGFPTLWFHPLPDTEHIISAKPLQYVTYIFDGSTTSFGEYQEPLHILLNAHPDETTDIEGEQVIFKCRGGTPANFPNDLKGISGCSVWKIGDTRVPFAEWGSLQPKVVGVETNVYTDKNKAIRVTRWAAVSTLLAEAFPELKPAILLWRSE